MCNRIRLNPIMPPVKNGLFAEKLRELRGEMSLNQVQIESGINRGSLSKYEDGRLLPERTTLEKLAHYYRVDPKILLKLILHDTYPEDSFERSVLIEWVKELETDKKKPSL